MSGERYTRRDFLRTAAVASTALVLPGSLVGCATRAVTANGAAGAGVAGTAAGWDMVPGILARIRPPTFADRDFDITRHGAVADVTTDATQAIRAAIEACNRAGGGRVVVPAGRFFTGPITLRSNVNLHLAEGATLLFSTDPADYPIVFTRWEGVELMNYSPLIYAFEEENVAITGSGTLDGQAAESNWWPWKGRWKGRDEWEQGPTQRAARDRLFQMAEDGVEVEQRVFGEGDYLRPQFIQPYRCENVLIEGVTVLRSPMWQVNPVLCENVTVRNVRIVSHGPNNDGCNPESCRDVLIEGTYFDTGDDCIAIKSGRNADGRRIDAPSENIVIRNCHMKDGHGGVTLGSEISGGVRNVFAEDCVMDSPNLDRALRFKNNAMRGGVLENVYMRNVTIGQVRDAVLSIDLHYEEGRDGPFVPVVRNVEMHNVTSQQSNYVLYMRSYPGSEISDIRVVDCRFSGVERGNVIEGVEDIEFVNVVINGQPASATSHQASTRTEADRLPSDLRAPGTPRPPEF